MSFVSIKKKYIGNIEIKQNPEAKTKKAAGLPSRTPYVRSGKRVMVNVADIHMLAIAKEISFGPMI